MLIILGTKYELLIPSLSSKVYAVNDSIRAVHSIDLFITCSIFKASVFTSIFSYLLRPLGTYLSRYSFLASIFSIFFCSLTIALFSFIYSSIVFYLSNGLNVFH